MRIAFYLMFALSLGCASPAVRLPQKLVSAKELLAISLVREGSVQFNQSRFMDAELKFRQALYLYPNAQNIQRDLAVCLGKQGLISDAEKLFSGLNADSTQVTLLVAAMYYENGDLSKARGMYRKALSELTEQNKPQQALDIARSLSVLEFREGHEEDALCYSHQALALSGAGLDESLRHAKLLMALGAISSAKELSMKLSGMSSNSADPRVYYNLALAGYALGNNKEVLSQIAKAKEYGASERGLDPQLNLLNFLAKKVINAEDNVLSDGENLEDLHVQALEIAQQATELYLPLEFLDDLQSFIDGYKEP